MCLILFAYDGSAEQPLVVAANRDEFYARKTQTAHFWPDAAAIYGGRDEEAKGTWLAVDRSGRFAAVTNWTATTSSRANARSRGDLTRQFLQGNASASEYVRTIKGNEYPGYNFLAYDGDEIFYASNRDNNVRCLNSGVFGITNTFIDDNWPKVTEGAAAVLQSKLNGRYDSDTLLVLLRARTGSRANLDQNGGDDEIGRGNAPRFIQGDTYGTRSSTVVIYSRSSIEFVEQTYGPRGSPIQRTVQTIEIER